LQHVRDTENRYSFMMYAYNPMLPADTARRLPT
jgi:hypothetical protein